MNFVQRSIVLSAVVSLREIFQHSDLGWVHVADAGLWIFEPSYLYSDESAEVSSLLNHMKTEVNVLTDLTLSPGDLMNQWFRSECSLLGCRLQRSQRVPPAAPYWCNARRNFQGTAQKAERARLQEPLGRSVSAF